MADILQEEEIVRVLHSVITTGDIVTDDVLKTTAEKGLCGSGTIPRIRNSPFNNDSATIRWLCSNLSISTATTTTPFFDNNNRSADFTTVSTLSTDGQGNGSTNQAVAMAMMPIATFDQEPCWIAGSDSFVCPYGLDTTAVGTSTLSGIPSPTELATNSDGDIYIVDEVRVELLLLLLFLLLSYHSSF